MKITTLLTTLILTITCLTAQELVIEVTTDKYPDETSWKLYNISNELVYERNTFEKEKTHFDTIQLETTNCYYWTIYDAYSDGMSATNPGDYKLYIDGELFANCDNANFGDSVSIYNLGQACVSNDARVNSIMVNNYLSKDYENISFEIVNMSETVISSLSASFEVNDYSSEEISVSDINIELGEAQTITLPVQYEFTEAGNYTITVNLITVNGSIDEETVNNSASKDVIVVDGIVKKNMVEMISSAFCGPCYDANARMNEILFNNENTWTLTKYLLDWGDKKYVPGNDHRIDLYNAGGAPFLFINGEQRNWTTFSETTYKTEYLGNTADVKITIDNAELIGDSLFATITVLPLKDFTTKLYLRGVTVERFCTENLKSGAEYYHPSYGYLPNPEGFVIESMTANEPLTFTAATNITKYPLEDGSLTDLILNVYVQEDMTNIIYQSEAVNLTYTDLDAVLIYSIEKFADDIDAQSLELTVSSNRILFDNDGNEIVMAKNHFELKKDDVEGVAIPFEAEINEGNNKFIVTPSYGWDEFTTYVLVVKDLTSLGGVPVPNDTIAFSTTNLIDKLLENSISLYPNPASNYISFDINESAKASIINIQGQYIKTKQISPNNNILDITDLVQGVYYVKMNFENVTHTVKFLKQ